MGPSQISVGCTPHRVFWHPALAGGAAAISALAISTAAGNLMMWCFVVLPCHEGFSASSSMCVRGAEPISPPGISAVHSPATTYCFTALSFTSPLVMRLLVGQAAFPAIYRKFAQPPSDMASPTKDRM